ncbi:reverse transcriptase domain-containing protein [Tanacetum coccineum]
MIGSTLIEKGRNKLCDLLQCNLDVFAWNPADMTGVPRHVVEHRLNIRQGCPPVRQKRRSQAADRNQTIQEEVEKLVDAGIMKEVHYHNWLSNPVMVKKHDDSWRMCVDFKDMNKACPKDGYPLPEINWKVESLCGFSFKCFLDAYKGYHQIKMAKEYEEKTTFITSQGVFCYSKMPFGLRNVGATYQRLVDKAFHKQIGKNLEVYVDDLVIKSRTKDEIIRDIEETFKTLREINMKLNPKKCTFGVEEGMFLGYKVNTKGIKVCSDKVDAGLSLTSPKCLKDVQKLNGKLASLNRFLAKSAKKSLSFFKTLKKCTKKSDFHWTKEAEAAFKQMKQLIAELPTLTAPEEKEELIRLKRSGSELHINGKIGFSSGTCQKASEKILPSTPNYSGHRSTHKATDFIVERPEEDDPDTAMEVEEELSEPWIMFTDGSSCADGSRAILVLTNPEGAEFTYALRFRFAATNNEAEYEALIAGLRIAEEMGVKNLQANVDSRLVANPVNGTYIAKEREETLPVEVNKVRAVWRTRSVVAKALRSGYYWPTMHKDARELIRACQDYQAHRPIPRNPQQKLTPITSLWPFYKFGLLGEIISDNGKQFRDNPFKDWCEKLCIRQRFASVKHPQANRLVERANRSLGEGINARLDARSKNWMEEISHVLWAHRTMIKSSNGDTPFSLTYGTEAVILAEIGMPTLRTAEVDIVQNNEALGINLDLLEEWREHAAIREAKSKAKIEKYYNSKVRSTSFKPGDLMYRSNNASHAEEVGKLGPKWEGPYEVTEALGKGACKLRDRDGKQLPQMWNVRNLKKCHVHEM